MNDKIRYLLTSILLCGSMALPGLEQKPLQREVDDPAPAEFKDVKPARSSELARSSNPPKDVSVKATEPRPEKLKLLNGDNISGKFLGLKDGKVLWQHPSFKNSVLVNSADVAEIRLFPGAGKSRRHNCTVELVNGDTLQGDLNELSETELILDTWYGGRLKLPRSSVRVLRPGQAHDLVVYEGPDGSPDGWQTGNRNTGVQMRAFGLNNLNPLNGPAAPAKLALQILGKVPQKQKGTGKNWRFVDNGFNCSSSGPLLGRKDLELPDRCQIEFDIQWSNYFGLGINLYADNIKNEYTGNSYSLRMDHSNVYLYRISNNSSSRVGINIQSRMQQPKTRAHVVICVNKDQKTFTLLVDDQLVHKWKDNNANFAGKGNGLLFTSRNSYPMRLSNIRISEWDGNLPQAGDGKNHGNGKDDYVQFTNEDSISGKAKTIRGGKLILATSFAEVPVEMTNVSILELTNPVVKVSPKAGQIHSEMRARGRLTFTVQSWVNGKVRVMSPYFGIADFDPSVFEKLEFNNDVPRRIGGNNIFGP